VTPINELRLSTKESLSEKTSKRELYHCPFEIGLCSGKGGHCRLGRVETGLLSRTLPIGIKGADRSTQARRTVPLYFFDSRLHRVLAEIFLQLHLPRNKDRSPLFAAPTAPSPL
jgi:hypothetical protein